MFVFAIILFLKLSASIVECQDSTTTNIALVEYNPIENPLLTPIERLEINTQNAITILEEIVAKTNELYLIAFSENALHHNASEISDLFDYAVDVLQTGDVPCQNQTFAKFVQDLSCAAKEHNTSILISLTEKEICSEENRTTSFNCKEYGHFIYSTIVIFDPTGSIYQTYHKFYLLSEKFFDNYQLDVSTFPQSWDSEKKYGIIGSLDILLSYSANQHLQNNITHFLHLTSTYLDMPFLTAHQLQQMFAQSSNVTVLSVGAGATGIFQGDAGLIKPAQILETQGSKAYIYQFSPDDRDLNIKEHPTSNEDIDELARQKDDIFFKRDPQLSINFNSIFTSTTLDIEKEYSYVDLSISRFSCKFSIEILVGDKNEAKDSYTYQMIAFWGFRNLSESYQSIVYQCGIVACLNSSLSSCGQRFSKYEDVDWPVTFTNITVDASIEEFDILNDFYPSSLVSSMTPVNPALTTWNGPSDVTLVGGSYSLNEPQGRILTFGVYGVYHLYDIYDNDYNHNLVEPTTTTVTTTNNPTTTTIVTTTPQPNGSNKMTIKSFVFLTILFLKLITLNILL